MTDLELITLASSFAAEAHVHQKRKVGGTPYINHPLRVAAHAAGHGLSAEAIAASVLHDVIEDTDATVEDLETLFPPRVIELVKLLTQPWEDDAPASVKDPLRPGYFAEILRDADAVSLKLLDRGDNLRDMAGVVNQARKWAERYLERSRKELASLEKAEKRASILAYYRESLKTLEEGLAAPAEG